MSEEEKYEELRKHYEKAEEREQQYIVKIQKLMNERKESEKMGINANIEVKRKMAAYIIENNVSSTEVAKHFNTSRSGVMQHINYLKDIDYELYKKAITVLKTVGKEKQNKGSQKTKDEIKLEVANYIIENKCTYVEASRQFFFTLFHFSPQNKVNCCSPNSSVTLLNAQF